MTTATYTQQPSNGLGKIAGLVFLLFASFGILFIVAFLPMPTEQVEVAQIVKLPNIQAHAHADKHPEAPLIRSCLKNKGGAEEIFRHRDRKRYYALCQLPDGRWGIQEFIKDLITGQWDEMTTFVPKDGTRNAVINYLKGSGSKFNGPFPW